MNKTTQVSNAHIEALKKSLDFISRLKFADAEPEPELVMAAIRSALAEQDHIASVGKMVAEPVKYGCHCDLAEGMEPDGCVIDEGRPQDCLYAQRLGSKDKCEYWKPIVVVPVKQADESLVDEWYPLQEPMNRPPNCGTGYCSCIECPYESVKPSQLADASLEPVDFESWWNETGQETLYALNTLTDADAKILAKITWESASTQPVKQKEAELPVEPVGWVMTNGVFTEDSFKAKMDNDALPVYREPVDAYDASHLKAIRDALANARAEALEKAAKWFENITEAVSREEAAAAIRGLIK